MGTAMGTVSATGGATKQSRWTTATGKSNNGRRNWDDELRRRIPNKEGEVAEKTQGEDAPAR